MTVTALRLAPRPLAQALLLLSMLAAAPAWSWETLVEEENLLVQRRPWIGSELQEIRGITRIRASLNAIMALLKDAEFNRHWVYRSGGASILQESGYKQAYVYGVVDAPWPMTDRDTVVRFDYRQESESKLITIVITNFPEFVPYKPGFVRVPEFGGFWQLRPEPGGWVEVTYQVHGDPGGWIPVWVANRAAALSVTNTLRAMPGAAKLYRGASSEMVEEL